MTDKEKCIKCGGALVEGFIVDHGDGGYKRQQIWIEGAPEASFWSGLKTKDKQAFNVRALRCADCNFLEFYTTGKVDLDSGFSELFTG